MYLTIFIFISLFCFFFEIALILGIHRWWEFIHHYVIRNTFFFISTASFYTRYHGGYHFVSLARSLYHDEYQNYYKNNQNSYDRISEVNDIFVLFPRWIVLRFAGVVVTRGIVLNFWYGRVNRRRYGS